MVAIQRPVKGARISSFYPVQELPPLTSLDSAFQLQEYISLLIRLNVHDVDTIVSLPGKSISHDRDSSDGSESPADKEGKGEVTVDESCWVYEQLRRLAQDLSHPLITTLQQECTRQTCPEMKAGEWLYLCVAHGNEGAMEQCCAIDYILHTLDSATALLNSPRAFPSRLSIPPASTRHFSSLARRLGRIFAHAYYHHREAFEQAEAESSLYARFLALTSKFGLVPTEFLVIPPRMSIHTQPRSEQDEGEGEEGSPEDEGPSDVPDISREDYMNTARRISNQERQWLQPSGILTRERGVSPPGPAGDARNPSPRKGRSRTDTMVHSEAVNVAEELARGQGFSDVELDSAIAQERILSTEEPLAAPIEIPIAEAPHEEPPEQPEAEEAEETHVTKASEPSAEETHPEPSEPAPAEPAPSESPAEEEHAPVAEAEEPKEEPAVEHTEEEVDVTEGGESQTHVESEQVSEPAAHEEHEADIATEPAEETDEADEEEKSDVTETAKETSHEEVHPEPAAAEEEEKPETATGEEADTEIETKPEAEVEA
ncbi:Mob1/phocein family-like protein [Phanerochaete sordida]|uniref:Mob1/phocein family-like protein n=1 Tax=Phanerochaete sordida TaxID=48140 RepID=A0A9P3G0C6_9APHY|nr:Mob1/phocein family-like protein [Phanerochaete sordida]